MPPPASVASRLRRAIPAGGLFALGICAILACDDHDEFREDVVLCEEAVAHLQDCCPHVPSAKTRCKYLYEPNSVPHESHEGEDCNGVGCGCNSDRLIEPDLSETVSQCLLRRECAGLRSTCDALARGEAAVCP